MGREFSWYVFRFSFSLSFPPPLVDCAPSLGEDDLKLVSFFIHVEKGRLRPCLSFIVVSSGLGSSWEVEDEEEGGDDAGAGGLERQDLRALKGEVRAIPFSCGVGAVVMARQIKGGDGGRRDGMLTNTIFFVWRKSTRTRDGEY